MKVIYGIGRLKLNKPSCVSVGVFDGLHRGHQAIIKKTVSLAKKRKLLSVILTFSPHPDSIVKSRKKSPLLISLKHRISILSCLGVDVCVIARFNSSFRKISAKNFISDILIRKCHMEYLVASRNFIFGKNKMGKAALLKALAREFNFKVYFQKDLMFKGKVISSTLIRLLIRRGDLEKASDLLGRRVEVVGTVVGGDSRGRKLGFPTANIDPHHEVIPPRGVYLVEAWLANKKLPGLANIGLRPTFKKENKEIIEIHLLNFKKNIYFKDLRIVFLKKLRSEKKFKKRSSLIEQINQDIQQAKSFFSV
ncbi:MAG: riboflavin biosynthesis protein RibF [Candidatus Omnitrophica bacterium]|nr:riboflavin biosynthesis protein RibF [Candidatus Omnitrophota bacterium]MDD5352802.1 riboflavin biosynthesis protein RibF [Candidatus Omnitrophota bacterium]MDD5550401.1 riboflavin biosynthesis protein RibF [Candidatus Omnitrophota bacterium]